MKVSELTMEWLRDNWLKASDNAENNAVITMALPAAIQYIKSNCNLTDAELDDIPDMPLAVCGLVADMFDVRQHTVDGSVSINPTTDNIIGRYDNNFL